MGVRVIRAFNKIDYEKNRFDRANSHVTNTYIRANRIMAILMPLAMLGMNLAIVAILWYGAKGIDTGAVDLGSMVAFIQYVNYDTYEYYFPYNAFCNVSRAIAASERIVEVLDTKIEIRDPDRPNTFNEQEKGHIQFIDVSFKYPNAEEPVLRNINFKTKLGEVIGILGTTGSGKSTLVSLIPRLYDVTSGQIIIDGVDIRKVSQEELREKISYAPQKAIIFTDTVKENIRMGKPNATDEEIIEACKIAQAHDFIEMLPQGYEYANFGGRNKTFQEGRNREFPLQGQFLEEEIFLDVLARVIILISLHYQQ